MMSKSSYLTDYGDHNAPHLMFFQTDKPDAAWGANVRSERGRGTPCSETLLEFRLEHPTELPIAK